MQSFRPYGTRVVMLILFYKHLVPTGQTLPRFVTMINTMPI